MASTTVLTDVGREIVVNRLAGTAGYDVPSHMGWGTGTGTASESDTTLFTEVPEDRVAVADDVITDVNTDDTFETVATLEATASRGITNAGVFNTAVKGDAGERLFIKSSFDVVNMEAGDSLQMTLRWRLN